MEKITLTKPHNLAAGIADDTAASVEDAELV